MRTPRQRDGGYVRDHGNRKNNAHRDDARDRGNGTPHRDGDARDRGSGTHHRGGDARDRVNGTPHRDGDARDRGSDTPHRDGDARDRDNRRNNARRGDDGDAYALPQAPR